MRSNRKHERFVRRLETEFTAENKSYRGISSDLSINGLFIRTQHAFVPNTVLDIVIHLPHAADIKLKGKVRRAIKTPIVSVKNGMGVEILENDPQYIAFVRSVHPDAGEEAEAAGPTLDTSFRKHTEGPHEAGPKPEFVIITCPECGVKNKVSSLKLLLGPKCGKCRANLTPQA